jgi:hypothetical protein
MLWWRSIDAAHAVDRDILNEQFRFDKDFL